MKFELGQMVATPGALQYMKDNNLSVISILSRHANGDWSDMDKEDAMSNYQATQTGGRIFSSFKVGPDKLWVITEADRSSTCILLPDEY